MPQKWLFLFIYSSCALFSLLVYLVINYFFLDFTDIVSRIILTQINVSNRFLEKFKAMLW
ncbi:hypothetical protein RT99_01810 [Flavobacterium sp. MEB061]|nr:hypothetical protein RT99_01810 [Flavobacterium sp. MEB061]